MSETDTSDASVEQDDEQLPSSAIESAAVDIVTPELAQRVSERPDRLVLVFSGGRQQCANCGLRAHEHDKDREYGDNGPPGTYYYKYYCP